MAGWSDDASSSGNIDALVLLAAVLAVTACHDYGLKDETPAEICDGVDNDHDGEVDEGFPDVDGDGRADCVDDDCPVTATEAGEVETVGDCDGINPGIIDDPWEVELEWTFESVPGEGFFALPVTGQLGDIDRLGLPTIIAVDTDPGQEQGSLLALQGDGDGVVWQQEGVLEFGGTAIGDVDADGKSDVIAILSDGCVTMVDGSGGQRWISDRPVSYLAAVPVIADLDRDGATEVIVDTLVLQGADGSVLMEFPEPQTIHQTMVVADVDLDGVDEVFLGEYMYDLEDGALQIDVPATFLSVAVADLDDDPEGEIVSVKPGQIRFFQHDGSIYQTKPLPGDSAAPPAIADFDGDGAPEIAVPAGEYLAMVDTDGELLWQIPVTDPSCCAGCSAYDFDADGDYEVVYADQERLYIVDGPTGDVLTEYDSHTSGTVWEYPVIADVDGDDHVEIVMVSNLQAYPDGFARVSVLGNLLGDRRN